MTSEDIAISLKATSAKIWPRERDDSGTFLLAEQQPLNVSRWYENETHALVNKGMWRRNPSSAEFEIKGALIGVDLTEYVPEAKRDRSCQIHRFGFT